MNKHFTLLSSLLLTALGTQAQALRGTVTVGGTNPTYPTITAAVAALQANGVGAGGVTVAIRPGTYAQSIALDNITGTSATNRLRFVGRGGMVTLQPVGTNATNDAAVSITACDFVTLDSLNVADGGTSATDQIETGYLITGTATKGSTNITVSNCSIRLGGGSAPVTSTNLRGVYILSAATAASGANNNNRILNVLVDKAATGVRIFGRADALSGRPTFPDEGNEVRGCVLGSRVAIGLNGGSGGTATGISTASQRRLVLADNRIDSVIVRNVSPIVPVSVSGMSFDNASGRLENNRVGHVRFAGQGGSQVFGIRASVVANDTLKVFNNFISGIQRADFTANSTDNTIYAQGIWLIQQAGGGGLTQIFHNSIVLPAEASAVAYPSAGVYLTGGSTGRFPAEVRNNIIINRKSTITGQNAFALVDGNTGRGFLTSNNNLLLTPGTNGAIGQTGRELGGTRVTATTLADWRTASATDANSVSKAVTFVSEITGNLRLSGASVGDRDLASPRLTTVLRDIDNAQRPAITYMGADEAATPLRTSTAQAAVLALQAYPNPTRDQLTLRYRQPAAGITRVTVLDALGRPVRTLTSALQLAGEHRQLLSLQGLTAGVYTVQVAVPAAGGAQVTAAARVSVLH